MKGYYKKCVFSKETKISVRFEFRKSGIANIQKVTFYVNQRTKPKTNDYFYLNRASQNWTKSNLRKGKTLKKQESTRVHRPQALMVVLS